LSLLAVLLAWTQLAFAAHQFEHSIAELDETCAVCVQLDRSGDACPPSVAIVDSAAAFQNAISPLSETVVVRSASPYQSRASP
jgi:hypothetical protein